MPENSGAAQSQVDINNIATDLNGKADVDLTNVNNAGASMGASWGMPSNSRITLTLGASGTTYTAPANGWYCFAKVSGTAGRFNSLQNTTSSIAVDANMGASGDWGRIYLPCKKGDIVRVEYNSTGDTKIFIFIYAVGSESEAN